LNFYFEYVILYIKMEEFFQMRTILICRISDRNRNLDIYNSKDQKSWIIDKDIKKKYSHTCLKRSPFGQRKCGLIKTGDHMCRFDCILNIVSIKPWENNNSLFSSFLSVINVTLPDEKQNYIHRIGRVGRAERYYCYLDSMK
jgi:hypothetical protein